MAYTFRGARARLQMLCMVRYRGKSGSLTLEETQLVTRRSVPHAVVYGSTLADMTHQTRSRLNHVYDSL